LIKDNTFFEMKYGEYANYDSETGIVFQTFNGFLQDVKKIEQEIKETEAPPTTPISSELTPVCRRRAFSSCSGVSDLSWEFIFDDELDEIVLILTI
jgi:hypothetical protein